MFGSSATPIRFESLESRRQLAADFIASIVTPAANATLAVGVEHVAYITVTNAGTAMDRDTRVALNLYASTDGTLDTSTDLLLGTRTISRMNSGESETEDIEFVIPSGLAGGTQYRLFALVDPANQFAESNENNNTSAPVAVIFGSGSGGGGGGSGADLTVSLNAPTTTLRSGSEAKLYVNVANTGSSSTSGAALVEIFMQVGEAANPATDTLLGTRSFISVSAGETELEDIEFIVPSGIEAGTRRLYAVIDRAGSVNESNDSNNTSASVDATFGSSSGGGGGSNADLTVSMSAPSLTLTTGREAKLYVTVANTGSSSTSAAALVEIYMMAGEAPNAATDTLLGTRSFLSVSSGENELEDIEFIVPSSISAGVRKIYAVIDRAGTVTETNNDNNTSTPVDATFATGSSSGGTSSGTDLSVALAAPTLNLVPGAETKLFVSVTNSGRSSTTTPALVEIFVMNGESANPASDTLLASRSFISLSSGEQEIEDIEFIMPSGLEAGSRRIYAVIDRAGSINETDESNNTSDPVNATIGTSTGGGSAGSDLSVSVIAPTSPLIPNVEQKIFVSVFNIGTGSVSSRVGVELYIMRGSSPDPAADTLLGSRTVSRVSAGERELEDIEFRLPSGVTAGEYQIYAIIDRAGTVTETNENNNISATVAATVGTARRDLGGQIGRTSVPTTVVQGTKVSSASVSLTVSNLGNQNFERSSTAGVRAYLRPVGLDDSSQDIAVSDSKRESLSSLTSGKSKASSLKLKLPANLSSGEYKLIVKIDDSGVHSESDESNNTLNTGRTIQIAAPTVDLAFSSSTYIAPSRAGQAARASVSVTNLGNSGFKNTATIQFFYVDSNSVETAASGITSKRIDLKAGKIQKFDKLLLNAAPTTPGTYTLVARVTGTGDIDATNNTVTVRTFTV